MLNESLNISLVFVVIIVPRFILTGLKVDISTDQLLGPPRPCINGSVSRRKTSTANSF